MSLNELANAIAADIVLQSADACVQAVDYYLYDDTDFSDRIEPLNDSDREYVKNTVNYLLREASEYIKSNQGILW